MIAAVPRPECPLWAKKPTCAVQLEMSALGQKRMATGNSAQEIRPSTSGFFPRERDRQNKFEQRPILAIR
jgi:hypothetical protein